jgi:hypothetical protein
MDISFNSLTKKITFWKLQFQPAILIWFLLTIRAVILELVNKGYRINNFLIFRYVYFHTVLTP